MSVIALPLRDGSLRPAVAWQPGETRIPTREDLLRLALLGTLPGAEVRLVTMPEGQPKDLHHAAVHLARTVLENHTGAPAITEALAAYRAVREAVNRQL